MQILVTGATGTVGSHVIRSLGERDINPHALSRSSDKLGNLGISKERQVIGDLTTLSEDPSLLESFDKLVLITPLVENEGEQGVSLVKAASEAGLDHLIFMSVHDAHKAPQIPHFRSKVEIHQALENSRIDFTVLMPNNFFQNDLWYKQAILDQGKYPQPLGSIGCSRVDVEDIAEAISNAVVDPDHRGKLYPLVGSELLPGEKIASVYSEVLGRGVSYAGDDLEEWSVQASQMLPGWLVEDLKIMYAFFQEQGLIASDEDLALCERILGRRPRDFRSFVERTVTAWEE